MKKGTVRYIAGILLFMVIMFMIELSLPKKFVWRPTFGRHDHQPFGCAVFDDIVSTSLPGFTGDTVPAYMVSDKTFYQLSQDSTRNYSLLVVNENLVLTETDLEALFAMLNRGNKIMLVSSTFDISLRDSLGFSDYYDFNFYYFRLGRLKQYVVASQVRDTLYWNRDSVYNDNKAFYFYPHLCGVGIGRGDSTFTVLATKNEYVGESYDEDSVVTEMRHSRPRAITRQFGKGEITIVSTPLLFTNYGMLDEDNSVYLFRLLSRLKGLPIIRTEAYNTSGPEAAETPLRYLLSQRPLRWGIYLTLAVILLFMAFTARREQRPIPVVGAPASKTLEFVRLIGTLFFQRKDHAGLVRKKFIYFADTLRRTIQIDIENGENDQAVAHQIAMKTGVSEQKILNLLVSVRPVVNGKRNADEHSMMRFIGMMNEIVNHI